MSFTSPVTLLCGREVKASSLPARPEVNVDWSAFWANEAVLVATACVKAVSSYDEPEPDPPRSVVISTNAPDRGGFRM